MYRKVIKGCIAVAILLLFFASLSSASCPWFLRGELYYAQCGVEKTVSADKGILANDPQAVAVVNPELITIDPKYGSIEVAEDGSFVYDPAENIQQGTYVTFQYNATNGACDAKYPAKAKFQVTCKCRPNIPIIPPMCTPVTEDDIRDLLEEMGVGCIGCGDITTTINLYDIVVDADGNVLPGTYRFCIKCPGCQVACGLVTVLDRCEAEVEDYMFCEGTVTMDELIAMATADARCIGCDLVPVLDFSGVTLDDEGYVSGGSFTGTCGDVSTCGGSDTGYITVVEKCDCEIDLAVTMGCVTPAMAEAAIKDEIGYPCIGDNCDLTAIWDFPVWPLTDEGTVANGIYEYTVSCFDATGLEGCDSTCIGEVVIDCQPGGECSAYAPDICLPIICVPCCEVDPLEDDICCIDYGSDASIYRVIEAIEAADGGCSAECEGEMTVIIPDGIDWMFPVQFEYTIECGSGDIVDSDTGIFKLGNCD